MFKRYLLALKETYSAYRKIDLIHKRELNDYKNQKVNLGQIQASLNRERANISKLSDVEFQVFSQFGDDGIIQYLIDKLPIRNKTFIEFGVENYREANTRFLLYSNYWAGMVIDGSDSNIAQIMREDMYSYFDLRALSSFITAENINELLAHSGFHKELGILSVDIDGNDYWVWDKITAMEPAIVICEYNSLFGFEEAITIPYDPSFVRGQNFPFCFYGTSLKAAQYIASKKGYFHIGCNSAGNNAYFIHEKYRNACPFKEISVEESFNYSVFTESRINGVAQKGRDKIKLIDGLKVIDVIDGKEKNFSSASVIDALQRANKFKGVH